MKAHTEAGTTEKMGRYRHLIAAGCGGDVSAADVDTLVGQILETLEMEAAAAPAPQGPDGLLQPALPALPASTPDSKWPDCHGAAARNPHASGNEGLVGHSHVPGVSGVSSV